MESQQELIISENQEEQLDQNHTDIPYKMKINLMEQWVNHYVPWHWHSFPEFDYILEGELEIHSPEGTRIYREGELAYFNSNVLHMLRPVEGRKNCRFYALLFQQEFLTGGINSTLSQKYFLPVTQSSEIQIYPIAPQNESGRRMIKSFLEIVEIDSRQEIGYEFAIQRCLGELWMCLYQDTKSLHGKNTEKNHIHVERLKKMLTCIHENYFEKMTLSQIASAADIGKRECLRCFRSMLTTSPIEYLNAYRISRAAQMLLYTSKPVIQISEDCGFSSNSYFTRSFQKIMGCSPREFRKKSSSRQK